MNYDWLLFDLDGTLFDYDTAERTALTKTFTEHGITYMDSYLDVYRQVNHQIWSDFEKGLITQFEIKTKRFEILARALDVSYNAALFSKDYLKYLSEGTHLIEGADTLLAYFHSAYSLALITNGLKDVQRPRIKASHIGHFFREVVISEEIGYAKPDPKFFEVTLQKIGNPPSDSVLIIGDSLSSDIMGGTLSGIDTCWYNPEQKKASHDVTVTYEIKNLYQLRDLLPV
jgi:putative hydrolase of the HAD superfamily